ncbi:hypothetical protein [Streptomyces aureus]
MNEPTPVTEDAHATPAQLLARAAHDYANGWGHPNARTEESNQ